MNNNKQWSASPAYARYVLAVLFFVALFNYLDRMVLAILLEPVKQEFALSDTQLGLLSGVAFAFFYATFGIPIARLADRGNRSRIIAWSFAAWSLLTVACGMAQNFLQLLLARIGVAIGEAGAVPPSQSLLADYFPIERRAAAFAVFSLGSNVGYLIGFAAGGLIAEHYGWRWAFILLGFPGLLFALLVRFSVREPRQYRTGGFQVPQGESFGAVLQQMFGKRSYRHVVIAFSLYSLVSYGATQWIASFLIRSHEMSIASVGVQYGSLIAIATGAGALIGGWLTNRLLARDLRWLVWLPGLTCLLVYPFSMVAFTSESTVAAMACLSALGFSFGFMFPPTISSIHALAGEYRRATAAALAYLFANIIGLGMGPLLIGLASDMLQPMYADNSLAIGLVLAHLVLLWAAAHYLYAAKWIGAEIEG